MKGINLNYLTEELLLLVKARRSLSKCNYGIRLTGTKTIKDKESFFSK